MAFGIRWPPPAPIPHDNSSRQFLTKNKNKCNWIQILPPACLRAYVISRKSRPQADHRLTQRALARRDEAGVVAEHKGELAAVAAQDVFVGRRDFRRVNMGKMLQK
jgi:hypothetical protein